MSFFKLETNIKVNSKLNGDSFKLKPESIIFSLTRTLYETNSELKNYFSHTCRPDTCRNSV